MYGPPMWKAFQRYRQLDPGARELFWQAVVLLPSLAVSLRVRGRRIVAHDDPGRIGELCELILADVAKVLGRVNV
jgi:hypothetical protein